MAIFSGFLRSEVLFGLGAIVLATAVFDPPRALAIENWAYQLQNVDSGFNALRDSAFQLLVIEHADDDGVPLSAQTIAQLQNGVCGTRPVVAYMSIGEAEDYRFYWHASWADDPPAWLGPENPDWPGNYKVRYWDAGWQQYIVPPGLPEGESYLEQILAQGFDGVYLDIIDAYEYWEDENPDSARDMVSFVSKIAAFARSRHPGFLVFPQNGSGLVDQAGYLAMVSGIGAEDTWYDGNDLQDPALTGEVLPNLRKFKNAGKIVLAVDYVTQQALINDFYAKAQAEGFVPYATVRDLHQLIINPGHEPACPEPTPTPSPTPTATPATPTATPTPLPPSQAIKKARFWAYQIQSLSQPGAIDALAESRYDLLVLDPVRSDKEEVDFDTAVMVQRLHDSPGTVLRRKLVVAYVDIGEAEDWRWYWGEDWVPPPDASPFPDFLLAVDPDGWAGNYPIAYWDPRWREIIVDGGSGPRSALDQVIDDGFDGIYMDWVEAYSNEDVAAAADAEGLDPAEEMEAFIRAIRTHAQARNPEFLVIPQNASELLELRPDYLTAIDAFAQEQIYFDGEADTGWNDPLAGDQPVPETGDGYSRQWYEEQMLPYLAAGLPVYSVDYARKAPNVAEAYQRALQQGTVPYVSLRPLDRLTETPPPGYRQDVPLVTGLALLALLLAAACFLPGTRCRPLVQNR